MRIINLLKLTFLTLLTDGADNRYRSIFQREGNNKRFRGNRENVRLYNHRNYSRHWDPVYYPRHNVIRNKYRDQGFYGRHRHEVSRYDEPQRRCYHPYRRSAASRCKSRRATAHTGHSDLSRLSPARTESSIFNPRNRDPRHETYIHDTFGPGLRPATCNRLQWKLKVAQDCAFREFYEYNHGWRRPSRERYIDAKLEKGMILMFSKSYVSLGDTTDKVDLFGIWIQRECGDYVPFLRTELFVSENEILKLLVKEESLARVPNVSKSESPEIDEKSPSQDSQAASTWSWMSYLGSFFG